MRIGFMGFVCFCLFFLQVAVSASCQEPCCPAHIMFFHCVMLLCYAPDVEQIKMMMMMMITTVLTQYSPVALCSLAVLKVTLNTIQSI